MELEAPDTAPEELLEQLHASREVPFVHADEAPCDEIGGDPEIVDFVLGIGPRIPDSIATEVSFKASLIMDFQQFRIEGRILAPEKGYFDIPIQPKRILNALKKLITLKDELLQQHGIAIEDPTLLIDSSRVGFRVSLVFPAREGGYEFVMEKRGTIAHAFALVSADREDRVAFSVSIVTGGAHNRENHETLASAVFESLRGL